MVQPNGEDGYGVRQPMRALHGALVAAERTQGRRRGAVATTELMENTTVGCGTTVEFAEK